MKSCFYRKIIFVTVLLNFIILSKGLAQGTEAYPSNWFTQMKLNKVQILFRNTNANFSKATIEMIAKIHSVRKAEQHVLIDSESQDSRNHLEETKRRKNELTILEPSINW